MSTIEMDELGGVSVDAPADAPLRQVPGAKWDHEAKLWRLPLSWATCVAARDVLGAELAIGPELTAWGQSEAERAAKALEARDDTDAPEPPVIEPEDRELTELDAPVGITGDVTTEWWWDLYRGMPEFVNRRIDAWKTVKVHLRGPADLIEFEKVMRQTVNARTRAVWYPPATPIQHAEWRWVDEDTPTEDMPDRSRKEPQKTGRKPKSETVARPRKPRAAAEKIEVKSFVKPRRKK